MSKYQDNLNVDQDGYRKNVGIIVCNNQRQVLWARRSNHDGWQFPQGGVEYKETLLEAVFRELHEEIGLRQKNVRLLGSTEEWLKYDVPYISKRRVSSNKPSFKGQKQRWFLFQLIGDDLNVKLDACRNPEFDHWQWVDYWSPINHIVKFKKAVYQQALTELEPLLDRLLISENKK